MPDEKGQSKCKYLHIGPVSQKCPSLQVHGTNMQQVDSVRYLGDWIESSGSNKLNVNQRVSRGLGAVSQIMSILESVSLGHHYFSIATLLRESLLVNSMLCSVEIWYNLKYKDICELANVDKILHSNIFSSKK